MYGLNSLPSAPKSDVSRGKELGKQVCPRNQNNKPRHWRGFVVLVLGQHSNLQPSLAYEPSHNLKADAVKKSLRWSDFKRKVEHGEAARKLRKGYKLTSNR